MAASDPHAPLLPPRQPDGSAARPVSLAHLLGRATGRRGASMLVRETAARELEERRADWGYSKPVVALDMLWNTAFVVVSVVMLIMWLEYRRRNSRRISVTDEERGEAVSGDVSDSEDEEDSGLFGSNESSITKRCETVNTMASFLWWIVGFYWVVSGGDILLQNAPRLYWLAVVFLAFDVFFAIFCVVLACLIGIALFCCLPCIIAILYAITEQEGASEADLSILPKYRFQIINNREKPSLGAGKMIPIETSSGYLANERILLAEDAECCICLSSYEDGVDLHALPCNHHFHSTCIVKWLKMNATCPLCKYNILKGNEQV
ncbi:hypothetical protein V6Z11_A03G142700 [Gossypium hirsutum]